MIDTTTLPTVEFLTKEYVRQYLEFEYRIPNIEMVMSNMDVRTMIEPMTRDMVISLAAKIMAEETVESERTDKSAVRENVESVKVPLWWQDTIKWQLVDRLELCGWFECEGWRKRFAIRLNASIRWREIHTTIVDHWHVTKTVRKYVLHPELPADRERMVTRTMDSPPWRSL